MTHPLLRIALLLIGSLLIVLASDIALGGLMTLGLQFDAAPVDPGDPSAYTQFDNHIRFFGGLFAAIGALLVAATLVYRRLRVPAMTACGIVAAAGLLRLSEGIVTDPRLLTSLAIELIGFPALAYWIYKAP